MEQKLHINSIMQNRLFILSSLRTIIKRTLTICFYLILSQSVVVAGRGGDGSGGGSFVKVKGKTMLLDLYVNNSPLGKESFPLSFTPALQKLGIDHLKNQSGPIMEEVLRRIESWKSANPLLASAMLETLKTAPIYLINYRLKNKDLNYDLDNHPPPEKIETAALTIGGFGTLISYPDLQNTDSESQVSLINHEIFRLLFIVHGKNDVSPKNIQRLTHLFSQDRRDVPEINSLELLGEELFNSTRALKVVQANLEFKEALELCDYVMKSVFLKTYHSTEVINVKSSCSQFQNSQTHEEVIIKQVGALADAIEIFLDYDSLQYKAGEKTLANTMDRRADRYSLRFSELSDFGVEFHFFGPGKSHLIGPPRFSV